MTLHIALNLMPQRDDRNKFCSQYFESLSNTDGAKVAGVVVTAAIDDVDAITKRQETVEFCMKI